MTSKWKNAGAPFSLSDGTRVETGQVFEASALSRDVRMRRNKLHPMAPYTKVTAGRTPDVEQYAVGGGWYRIDGVTVQGRKKAQEVLSG